MAAGLLYQLVHPAVKSAGDEGRHELLGVKSFASNRLFRLNPFARFVERFAEAPEAYDLDR